MRTIKLTAVLLSFLTLAVAAYGCSGAKPREEIVVSVPYSAYIRNMDTNYYKQWLEEQTGFSIKFNIIYETLSVDYLRSTFQSGYVQSDAFFSPFGVDAPIDFTAVLQEFGGKGYILPLNEYVDQSLYLKNIYRDFPMYDLRSAMTSPDGNIYYMPGFDPSLAETNYQVLWLNQGWLKKLKLSIPQTTSELRDVLYAFKTKDPNGNGKPDEIPLAGSRRDPGEHVFNFIINAFVYNDPDNSRLFLEDDTVRFAPVTNDWREAMQYLNKLYADGLLSPYQFSLDHNGLEVLANDPWNILGGFTSQSVTDVIFPDNREIIHDFIHVAPLFVAGKGARRATARTPIPVPAGVVTANCRNPRTVFALFDLMLSEEAFLIGRYGEKGTDWIPGKSTDTNFYGREAAIRVLNPLANKSQNKHLGETGPFFAYPRYADSVTISTFEADAAYMNARAYRVYEHYKPGKYIKLTDLDEELQTLRRTADAYTDQSIQAFITGAADPFDDGAWSAHVDKYREMNIKRLIGAAQSALTAR